MQAVAARRSGALDERPVLGAAPAPEPAVALCDVIRARSVLLGEQAYIEHASTGVAMTFRQLEGRMERWRALLSAVRPGSLSAIGLVVDDPIEFADVFLGCVSAGFWVAPLDPSLPVRGRGGLGAALARSGVEVVLADRPTPAGIEVE
jgi:acyl-CoA synthetase (AMP-forming)/AMP-acid ligase II